MPDFMMFSLLCPERVHADALALLRRLFEPYLPVNQGEQGVIASYSNVATWFDDRAALTHEDRAGPNDRAVTAFHAKPLALAVTTVARATDALLMCHVMCLPPVCVRPRRVRVRRLRVADLPRPPMGATQSLPRASPR